MTAMVKEGDREGGEVRQMETDEKEGSEWHVCILFFYLWKFQNIRKTWLVFISFFFLYIWLFFFFSRSRLRLEVLTMGEETNSFYLMPLIKEAAHFAFVYLTFKDHLKTRRYRLAVRAIGFGTLDQENSQTHLDFSSQV